MHQTRYVTNRSINRMGFNINKKVVTLISKSMTKSDFNNSVFVVKVYEHTTPSIVEVFPATEQGISDAY